MLKAFRVISIFFIVVVMCISVNALERQSITNVSIADNAITTFVKNSKGREIQKVSIADNDVTSFDKIDEIFVRTAILVDSSISENEHYNDMVKAVISRLLLERAPYESFVIAAVKDELSYISEDNDDYINLLDCVDNIKTNTDSKGSLCDSLYIFLEDIEKLDTKKYNQIILISDEDKKIKGDLYKKSELEEKIKSSCIPIYTIGFDMREQEPSPTSETSQTEKELFKNISSLSKLTQTKSYVIQKKEDIAQSVREISVDKDSVSRIMIFPSIYSKNAENMSLKIYFDKSSYCEANVDIPINNNYDKNNIDNNVNNTAEYHREMQSLPFNQNYFLKHIIIISIIVILLIAIIVAVILIIVRKRKNNRTLNNDYDYDKNINTQASNFDNNKSVVWSNNYVNNGSLNSCYEEDDNKTSIIINTRKIFNIHLQDKADASMCFEYAFKDHVVIGKNPNLCQIVINYSPYISSTHCEVFVKNNTLFVRDGGEGVISSTNGTFVNGQKASPEIALPNGSVLSLANLNFKVTYKQ